ncbi:MAG: ankyrin repeat domain-containing protein [Polyangiaceae bacterium]
MSPIAEALATEHFPAAEVAQLLDAPSAPMRGLVLAALRATSEERFLEGLEVFFASLDWAEVATASGSSSKMSLLTMLGAARGESATDHLAATEIVRLSVLAEQPDAAFALDVVRALEFGDPQAGERVFDRVEKKLRGQPVPGMYSAPDNPVAARRLAHLLRGTIADQDEEQLRALATRGMGHGAWPAWVAAAIAEKRGLTLVEDVASLPDSSRLVARILTAVAHAIEPTFGEEMLKLVVDNDWTERDLEALALPWEGSVESLAAGKLTTTRRLGSSILKGVVAFDGYVGPPPRKRPSCRLSVKQYATPDKAKKAFDKVAAAAESSVAVEPAALAERLHAQAAANSGRLRVLELLRRGAAPTFVDEGHGETPLHRGAASADCGEIVRLLLEAGADPNVRDKYGMTPLDRLDGLTQEHVVAATRLVEAGGVSASSSLFKAAERGFHRLVPLLHRGGADPREQRNGKTPFDVATDERHLRTAGALAALA